jgi:hypothetical protein
LLKTVSRARQGERNSMLYWAANRLHEMILDRELDRSEAERALAGLVGVARSTGLPISEIQRTIASAMR